MQTSSVERYLYKYKKTVLLVSDFNEGVKMDRFLNDF